MRKEMRWAGVAAAVFCGTALAFGDEAKQPQQKQENKKERLTPEKRAEAKEMLSSRSTEIKELREKANTINKNIGELASSGKLTTSQEAVDQMKQWVDELAKINQRLAKIEEEIAGIQGWIEGQNEALPVLNQNVSDLLRSRWANYVQFQYVNDERAGNFDSFRMRRVRLGLTQTIDPKTSLRVSFDLAGTQFGSTINEPAESTAQLRDAYLTYDIEPSDVAVGFQARLGRQALPMGYELERSSGDREFPERTQYNQSLFPGERSNGITLTKGLGSNALVQVGGYNALTYNDPQQRTTGAAPGSKLAGFVGVRTFTPKFDLGVSYFKGQRETIRTTSGNPPVTVVSPKNDREFLYVDATYVGLFDPKLFIRAEAMQGTDRLNKSGAISATATADNIERDLNGHQLHIGYNINPRNQINFRWEVFDRDTDIDGDAVRGYALSYIYYLNPTARLMAALEEFKDPLRSTQKEYRVTTLRVQFRF